MDNGSQGAILGLPTMMAIFPGKVEVARLLDALKATGHPLEDVSAYYRVKGTDQVIDAATGRIAAGEAITEREIPSGALDNAETVVILHPQQEELGAIRKALSRFGEAQIEYEEATKGESTFDAALPHEELKP